MTNMPISYYIARFLIGFLFVYAAVGNTLNFRGSVTILREKKLPLPNIIFASGIIIELITGIMIILGVYVKLAASILILFTIVAILIFHDFWNKQGVERFLNQGIFITHLTSTIGALLLLTVY